MSERPDPTPEAGQSGVADEVTSDPGAELVPLYDDTGSPTGEVVPRREVRAHNLRHAATVVLVRNGGVAWLSPAPGGSQLNAADTTGRRILDVGAIAPGSLRAEISIISWVRDGVERFARLR